MSLGRSAVVKLVALCLLAAPVSAVAQQAPAMPSAERQSYRSDRALRKVIIYGSVGAIVGALGSLRVRRGRDNVSDE